jgi:hypothetical protein
LGYYHRKLEDQRRTVVEKEAAARRGVLEDCECLIAAWNERQAKCMPVLLDRRRDRQRAGW